MVFWVGPHLRRSSRSLASAPVTFQRRCHKDAWDKSSQFPQPQSFCVIKAPHSHPKAAVQGFLLFPTSSLNVQVLQDSFPHYWLCMSPHMHVRPPGCLELLPTKADGFGLCAHSPGHLSPTSLHPLVSQDTTWGEKICMEGTHLAPFLTPPHAAPTLSHLAQGYQMHVPAASIPRALWKPAEPRGGCAAAGWMCRSWMDALRCCSRCERQRPARGRAPSGMEAAPAAAGDAQPLPWLGAALPLTSFPPVARRVSQLSPLPSSGGQCVSWCFVQRQEKFSCRATGDSGLVLGA